MVKEPMVELSMDILNSLHRSTLECVHLLPELRGTVSRKLDNSAVTQADYLLDERISTTLHAHLPGLQIVSEEKPLPEGLLEHGWVAIVDPLDGTENFVSGIPIWGVSVSIWRDSQHMGSLLSFPDLGMSLTSGDHPPKADSRVSGFSTSTSPLEISQHPAGSNEYRVLGAATFYLFCVATGRLKSFHNLSGAYIWDIAAGINLALEQGCKVKIDNRDYTGEFLAPSKRYRVEVFSPEPQ